MFLIIGFAFSFFIMLHKGKNSDEVDHFENPFKAFVKTLIMAQGEYQVPFFLYVAALDCKKETFLWNNQGSIPLSFGVP